MALLSMRSIEMTEEREREKERKIEKERWMPNESKDE